MKNAEWLADWIAPGRTALLVIDMQKDFAGVPGAREALTNAVRLADAARAAGVLCVFTGFRTRPETDSPVWRERLRRCGRDADRDMAICREATPGAAFVAQPGLDDLVVIKRRYSAFVETGLAATLRSRRIDTLVVCGLTTECCVEASVRDAFELDFHVFVARDACAGNKNSLHAAAIEALDRDCAIARETGDILRAWDSPLSGNP